METVASNILNVTILEPRMKHPTIFARFDELAEGETLTILNDHDPKPLYYQLLGERGNIFNWEYLEEGQEWWRVNIAKRRSGERDETVGQIAAKDLRKAEIFKKYDIDFCCGGKKTIKEACAEKGVDVTKVEQELQQADKIPASRPLPYNDWNADFLADYIVNTHHTYIRKTLPEIVGYAAKVNGVHGNRHPELARINELTNEVSAELTAHMAKEERIVFPFIKELVRASNNDSYSNQFTSVQQPVNLMQMEHESVAELIHEIKHLSNNFALPEDACATYTLFYKMLAEFEDDLHLHIHLENNILFPKAIQLEKERRNQ